VPERLKTYYELTAKERVVVDTYAKVFPETFKEIMDGTICNSDFWKHLDRWEGFKAGWEEAMKVKNK
jgi:hypothetical protein